MHVLQFSGAGVEKTAKLPLLHLVEFWTGCACLLCATTGAVWSMTWRSSSTVIDVPVATVEVPQTQFIAGAGGHSSSQQMGTRLSAVAVLAAMKGSLLQF